MSIVEKALQKLQSGGAAKAPLPPPPSTSVPRVSVNESPPAAPVPSTSSTAEIRRRTWVPNPAKTIRLDLDRLRHERMIPPDHQQRELSHQYRTLKRPLIKNAFDPSIAQSVAAPRSIMVTSALPGEGKTFTSLNLALSLALEKDHSVLLVDGDIPKPKVSTVLGLRSEMGLLDLLTDPNLPLESVVLPTDVRGLSILPVGRNRAESATELLASARMRQIIIQLERLDPQGLVLVDSPPILLTSEARVLASLFAQVVMVVKAGSTPQNAVTEAIGMIGEGPRLGLVLNEARPQGASGDYHGYYYGAEAPHEDP